MFQDAPIYHQLIAERGDVPAQVRDAAEIIRRQLQGVIRLEQPPSAFESGPFAGNARAQQRSALPPGQQLR